MREKIQFLIKFQIDKNKLMLMEISQKEFSQI